ncbi:copper-binding protein [Variovorax arabinosiphilus]|uniref:copper-binding protein n=1 Tax=Variovorax arabinosiphilus TaxID=3053498 RepID=UPI0025777CBA|nr:MULTISPECIES: copper-binding protein [unclassified Variovorax]MDM0122727.1 copper-binding protein [Variovorax sp. J2L1-78]MDM0132277.1 copper-binding protein [Variovorax sp. J2L1-63]MDM0235490.1 copper-binding protein [Variovorax sp. J2R1-6]
MTRRFITPLALGLATLSLAAFAQAPLPVVDAEVRKIDTEQQKITLRHGEIANLDMAPMTMVFRVKEPALLQKLKPGDKVRFTADKVDGALTVMTLDPAN